MAAESQSSAANMRTLGSSKASAAEQQEEEELETAPEPPKISTSPVVYTALSTWILAVSSVHVSVILFDRDVFAIPWLQGPYMSIDAWSLVHVFFYYAVALSYPNRFWGMMALGVLWEVLEAWFAGQTGNEWMGKVWEERGVNSLWDLYFNGLGYRLGETYLRRSLAQQAQQQQQQRSSPSSSNNGTLSAVSPYPIVFAFAAFCMSVGAYGLLIGKDPAAFVTGAAGMLICYWGWSTDRELQAKAKQSATMGREKKRE